MFNEQTLYDEIVKTWGYYGAHAEIYRELCKRAGLKLDESAYDSSPKGSIPITKAWL